MEHTFGDHELSLAQDNVIESEPDFKDIEIDTSLGMKKQSAQEDQEVLPQLSSMANESNIPWLHSKGDISLSTDSMFNLHDEEVKQLLNQSIEKRKQTLPQTDPVPGEIPEVAQLIAFIT